MIKWLHNDKMSLGWAIFVELVAHGFFAFQAFLLGGFLGDIALSTVVQDQHLATLIGAWALAIFLYGAALQAFVLGEYMKEHVVSYTTSHRADKSYLRSWSHIRWIVGGIELSSLAFRCAVVFVRGDYGQGAITLIFGLLLLYYAYAQAKVIHASVNRDLGYDVGQAKNQMKRDVLKDVMGSAKNMTLDEKLAFINDDFGGVSDARNRQTRVLDEQQAAESAPYEEAARNRESAEKLFQFPFLSAPADQATNRSQNGNGRHN